MQAHLTDGYLVLRPYQPGDVDALYEAVRESIPEVGRWLPWCHENYSRADSETWIAARPADWENGIAYSFAILDAGTGQYLGGTGLNTFNPQHRFANLGYWVRTSATKRGVATAATRLVARFGVAALGLTRIEIVAAVANTASQRVAEKAGAFREGVLRNRIVCHDRAEDAVVFSFIPDDFR